MEPVEKVEGVFLGEVGLFILQRFEIEMHDELEIFGELRDDEQIEVAPIFFNESVQYLASESCEFFDGFEIGSDHEPSDIEAELFPHDFETGWIGDEKQHDLVGQQQDPFVPDRLETLLVDVDHTLAQRLVKGRVSFLPPQLRQQLPQPFLLRYLTLLLYLAQKSLHLTFLPVHVVCPIQLFYVYILHPSLLFFLAHTLFPLQTQILLIHRT